MTMIHFETLDIKHFFICLSTFHNYPVLSSSYIACGSGGLIQYIVYLVHDTVDSAYLLYIIKV